MKRIFLTGYMGVGKTIIGRTLGEKINFSYIDTDHFIENRYRKKISEIFAIEGENRFREIEHNVISELSDFEHVVISTGGGLPCFNNNMELMNKKGITVYLEASATLLAARLEASNTVRPVLQGRFGEDLRKFISENLEKRRICYEQAKIRFNVEEMKDEKDIKVLLKALQQII
ncbi:MAG: shikimate kinase [Tannerella sp.]|jgi:shikimate kinase|nr:shikimate kinase [Tannerella sp.]